jgi:hypothetical protein
MPVESEWTKMIQLPDSAMISTWVPRLKIMQVPVICVLLVPILSRSRWYLSLRLQVLKFKMSESSSFESPGAHCTQAAVQPGCLMWHQKPFSSCMRSHHDLEARTTACQWAWALTRRVHHHDDMINVLVPSRDCPQSAAWLWGPWPSSFKLPLKFCFRFQGYMACPGQGTVRVIWKVGSCYITPPPVI